MTDNFHSNQKIAVIGAGSVGSTLAYTLMIKNIASEIILIDVNELKEEGEVMDIDDAQFLTETGSIVRGDYKDAADADIIISTAGVAQKPGETRLELVKKNKEITKSIFDSIGKLNPKAIIIMIANPVDVLTKYVQDLTGLPKNQVFGTGTALDTARLRSEIGKTLKVAPKSVSGYVLGEHGDSGFIAWSTVSIGGEPADKLLNKKDKEKIELAVRNAAYEIINRKGATFYGIAAITTDIVEAVAFDQHKIIPISSFVGNICLGMPAVIGRRGIEKLWPLELTEEEKKKLSFSGEIIQTYL